jgi:hypothetical protein
MAPAMQLMSAAYRTALYWSQPKASRWEMVMRWKVPRWRA